MLVFSVTSWVRISRLWIILIFTEFILMKKTIFEHCFIFGSNIYQYINKMDSGFPLASGPSDWPKGYPHKAHRGKARHKSPLH